MTKQEQQREYYANYREKNRERIREYSREWYKQNREAVCLMRKAKYIRKRKKTKEVKPAIMPRKYYNKITVYTIKTAKGYVVNLQNQTSSYRIWEAHFFRLKENAEMVAQEFENSQVVQIELKEKIGTQEVFWQISGKGAV